MKKSNTHDSKFPKALLHPKHWGSWVVASLLFALVKLLPYTALMRLGSWLGLLMEKMMPYRLLISKTNIQLCLADRDWKNIYKQHVLSLGKGVLEMSMGWFLDHQQLQKKLQKNVEHIGFEAVEKAKSEGRGVLFLGIHTTNLDFAAPLLANRYPVSPMYQATKSPVLNYLIKRARLRHCPTIIDRNNMREVIAKLKNGENIWYGCDQDFGSNAKSVFVPFYGVTAYTLPYYAKIAQKTGAAVIPVAGFRDDKKNQYILRYLPEIEVENLPESDAAIAMNKVITQLLEGYEDQYYWVHRRFKTRPQGEPALYPRKPRHIRDDSRAERKKHREKS